MRACAGSVKLLLANGRVDPNMASQIGNTALIFAAIKGHAPVVALLLADGRVDPDLTNQLNQYMAARQSPVPLSIATTPW